MRALEFIRDHVTFKLPYDSSYHMKTPYVFILSNAENSITVFLFLTRKTNLEYIHSCKKLRGDNADYYAKKSYL